MMLAHRGPVDLLNGQKIDIGKSLAWNNEKEFHHVFPRAYMKSRDRSDFNSLANIVMLTSKSNIEISAKPPSVYLSEIRRDVGDQGFFNRLSTCLIPPGAADAALRDDYDEFLRLRSELLQQVAMELIGPLEGTIEEVSPELVEDEEPTANEEVD
ncbi:hypothetical protein ACQPZQ_34160 [Pseudonocardia sp. CA-142604]|uniref:hypothetical protein n=1 Tax=Pseudonocardia sp. CA-142604 TaxID=3240024 RepID=UPI003D8AE825